MKTSKLKLIMLHMLAYTYAKWTGYTLRTGMAMAGADDSGQIEAALKRISDEVKEEGSKALAEAQKGVKLSEAQKERIDEMLSKQGDLAAQVKDLEQKAARRAAEQESAGSKSVGEQAVESEKFKKFAADVRGGQRVSIDVNTKALSLANNSIGQAVNPQRLPGVNMLPNRRLTIRDLLMAGRTASGVITYVKESGFTNNAATVAEGARKPESTLTMVQVTETAKKIAHFIKASTEVLADVPQLRSIIDGRLDYGRLLKEEAQLLTGSGVGNNLNGIYTQATAYVKPTSSVADTTAIDRLRLALLQSELAEYPSDGLVLNPIDWTNIELMKDTTNRYIIGDPQGTLAPRLWNRPVVATQAMGVGTFLAGAFGMGAQIFDREDAQVVVATENEDDFVNNLVTILIEERLALAVYRPEAFIKGVLP